MTGLTRRTLLGSLAGAVAACFALKVKAESFYTTTANPPPQGYLATPENTPRCHVHDADGKRWQSVRWVHTGTGEAEVCVLDVLGRKQLTADMQKVLTQRVQLKAPIRLIPVEKQADA
jgi:hypothetical protein